MSELSSSEGFSLLSLYLVLGDRAEESWLHNPHDDVQEDADLRPLPRPDALGPLPVRRPLDGHSAAVLQPSVGDPGERRAFSSSSCPRISQLLRSLILQCGVTFVVEERVGALGAAATAVLVAAAVPLPTVWSPRVEVAFLFLGRLLDCFSNTLIYCRVSFRQSWFCELRSVFFFRAIRSTLSATRSTVG